MIRTSRFAPSPTGRLHLGHAWSAVQVHALARASNGRFLLRIEDIDPTRCRPEYRAAIGEDLRALGLDWNGPVRVQSEHLPEYRLVLNSLARRGLLYPCFCTRAEIAREIAHSGAAPHPGEAGPEGPAYPGTCRRLDPAERARRLSAGEPHALRLDMPAALATLDGPLSYAEQGHGRVRCDPARFGDAVLARKDAPASYHLCVTHDDALQGVTLVTRGEDLRAATDIHRLLQALMGWPEPRYAHHPLLLGPDGKRLAKRDGAKPVRQLLREGLSPREILALAEGSPAGGATPAA